MHKNSKIITCIFGCQMKNQSGAPTGVCTQAILTSGLKIYRAIFKFQLADKMNNNFAKVCFNAKKYCKKFNGRPGFNINKTSNVVK